jgi:hypothetical protein
VCVWVYFLLLCCLCRPMERVMASSEDLALMGDFLDCDSL